MSGKPLREALDDWPEPEGSFDEVLERATQTRLSAGAELVDPFATPEPEGRVSTFDMCDAITYKARTSQYDDPQLQPQLLQRTLQRLRWAADDGTPEVAGFARWVLEDLWHRAESGVPYGEDMDLWPDPEPRIDQDQGYIRRVTDVVEDL